MEMKPEAGVTVICSVCGLQKKPIGRDAAVTAGSLCDYDCPGYLLAPYPSDLWPGETREEFGYGGVNGERDESDVLGGGIDGVND